MQDLADAIREISLSASPVEVGISKTPWHSHCKEMAVKVALLHFSLGMVLGTSALGGPVLYAHTSVLLKKIDEQLTKLMER